MRGALPAIGLMTRRLFENLPAAGRGSPVLCLLLLMVAAVAYWSPLPSPESETSSTGWIGSLTQPQAAAEPPLLLKVGDKGQKIGLVTPHLADAEESRICRERGRGFFCDVVSEPTADLPPGALVKVIDRLELRQRVTGGSAQVTWYRVQAVKPDGTAMLATDGKIIIGWAQSGVFSPVPH